MRLGSDGVFGPAREIHAGSGYWSQDSALQGEDVDDQVRKGQQDLLGFPGLLGVAKNNEKELLQVGDQAELRVEGSICLTLRAPFQQRNLWPDYTGLARDTLETEVASTTPAPSRMRGARRWSVKYAPFVLMSNSSS